MNNLTFTQGLSTRQVIVVNATSLRSDGGLSILKQFLAHLRPNEIYYVFVDPDVNIVMGKAQVLATIGLYLTLSPGSDKSLEKLIEVNV